jgi:hypothetical protein
MTSTNIVTPFWLAQTVYKKHGGHRAGIVVAVLLEGDPGRPTARYRVAWPKAAEEEEHFAAELTDEAPVREF